MARLKISVRERRRLPQYSSWPINPVKTSSETSSSSDQNRPQSSDFEKPINSFSSFRRCIVFVVIAYRKQFRRASVTVRPGKKIYTTFFDSSPGHPEVNSKSSHWKSTNQAKRAMAAVHMFRSFSRVHLESIFLGLQGLEFVLEYLQGTVMSTSKYSRVLITAKKPFQAANSKS